MYRDYALKIRGFPHLCFPCVKEVITCFIYQAVEQQPAAAVEAPPPAHPRQSLFRLHLHRLLSKWYETFPPLIPTASSRLSRCPGQALSEADQVATIVPPTAASRAHYRRSIEDLEITISDVEGEGEAPASSAADIGGAPPNQAVSAAAAASAAAALAAPAPAPAPAASPARKTGSGAYSSPPSPISEIPP